MIYFLWCSKKMAFGKNLSLSVQPTPAPIGFKTLHAFLVQRSWYTHNKRAVPINLIFTPANTWPFVKESRSRFGEMETKTRFLIVKVKNTVDILVSIYTGPVNQE